MRDGRLSIRTDLMDAHLYILHKQTFLKAVQARPSYKSIRQVTSAPDQTSPTEYRSRYKHQLPGSSYPDQPQHIRLALPGCLHCKVC